MRFGLPIEAHAAAVYTRNIFQKFQKEMFIAGSFGCRPAACSGAFLVHQFNVPASSTCFAEFMVAETGDERKYVCDCKMFEHTGLPCRHIIKVRIHPLYLIEFEFLKTCTLFKTYFLQEIHFPAKIAGFDTAGGARAPFRFG
jgi:hypothetical protein